MLGEERIVNETHGDSEAREMKSKEDDSGRKKRKRGNLEF